MPSLPPLVCWCRWWITGLHYGHGGES